MLCFHDVDFQLEERIKALSTDDPYTQIPYNEDLEAQYDRNNRVCCVYISNFFSDQNNLVYYIKGTRNIEMFYGGMTGMQAFNGAVLFAISPHDLAYILKFIKIRQSGDGSLDRLVKSEMPTEMSKWRFTYETGRLVWEKSDIDLPKLQELMEMKPDKDDPDGDNESHQGDDDMDIDPKDDQMMTSNPTHDERTMSAKQRGKKRASEENVEHHDAERKRARSDSIIFGCKFRGTEDLQTDAQTAEDRLNLEVFKRKKRKSSPDEIWTSLKDNLAHDIKNDELANRVISLDRREKGLARRRTAASSISGSSNITAELAELESGIAADRLRLIQRAANIAAHKWKADCAKILNEELRRRQSEYADKNQIKIWLMDILMSSGHDDVWGCKSSLETEEIQTVIDFADNTELQKECMYKVRNAARNDTGPEKLAVFENIRASLETEAKKYISQLATIMYKYRGHVEVRDVHALQDQEEFNDEGLSPAQEVLVANAMETMNCWDRVLIIRLLQENDWVAEAAIAQWCDRGCDNGNETSSLSKSADKQFYVAEAGPGSSKKRRTGTLDTQRSRSPEESLEAARARLEGILAKDCSAEQGRAQLQQETGQNAGSGPEPSKAKVQEKCSVAPGGHSLEVIDQTTANRTMSVDDTSKDLQIGFAKVEDEKAVVTKPSVDRRFSLRTRGQRTDYKALNNGIGPLKQAKQRENVVEANTESLSKQKRTRLSPPPASGPPVNSPTQGTTAVSPRDIVLGTTNTRSSDSSRQEIKAPSVTLVDNATAPSAQPTGSGS